MIKKRKIMALAWEYRKDVAKKLAVKVSEVSMSECLKVAWFQAKNTEITYMSEVIAKVTYLNVNECVVFILVNHETVDCKTFEYTDFQKVKIETVKLYKKLSSNEDVKMSRLDAYNKFLESKNLELQVQYSPKLRTVVSFKILSKAIRISYYDFKNWYGCSLDKYTKSTEKIAVLKQLGSDVEKLDGTYDSTTKTIKVKGVIEIIGFEFEYLAETIDYKDVLIDILHTIKTKGQIVKGYDMGVDRPLLRSYVHHAIFMMNLTKSDLEYYTQYVENRKTTDYFKTKYSFDDIKVAYAIVMLHKIGKGSEFYID